MTATMIGLPGPEKGDQLVYEKLVQGLPDGAIVYAQPTFALREEMRKPDYVVIYERWGVVVLEVKDWKFVKELNRTEAHVVRVNREEAWETSPVVQARTAAELLARILQNSPDLLNYAGKLDFSYAYGAVLPFVSRKTLDWMIDSWGSYLIGAQDLSAYAIAKRIESLPVPFRTIMSPRQVSVARAVVDPTNIVENPYTQEFKGIYSTPQETIAKEPLQNTAIPPLSEQAIQTEFKISLQPPSTKRRTILETGTPDEVLHLREDASVRLVRGFAGTGKTDVLILRVHHLYREHPNARILVTTFNRGIFEERLQPELQALSDRVDVCTFDQLCRDVYVKRHGTWNTPQNTQGMLAHLSERQPTIGISEYGIDFLADEFTWMKETGRTDQQSYVEQVREGRGGKDGRTLSKHMKEEVFTLFEAYQNELISIPAFDWIDLHDRALSYLRQEIDAPTTYDAILVDEAQHFAPGWMQILYYYLNQRGHIFLCDDPSQSVYRTFSWRQKGVNVVGRTRWLRVPYRNTRQIFQAAWALIEKDSAALNLLYETSDSILPDLSDTAIRTGGKPQIHRFPTWELERQFVAETIENLVRDGVLPSEICILHTERHVIDRYREILPDSVKVRTALEQTGNEFRCVIVPKVQELSSKHRENQWQEDQSRQRFDFYMIMTRARDLLILCYQQKWPKALQPVCAHCETYDHSLEQSGS